MASPNLPSFTSFGFISISVGSLLYCKDTLSPSVPNLAVGLVPIYFLPLEFSYI
jgi:hypothetical protein